MTPRCTIHDRRTVIDPDTGKCVCPGCRADHYDIVEREDEDLSADDRYVPGGGDSK